MATTKLARFQGSLVGGVVGDCIGAVFEGGWFESVELERILTLNQKIEREYYKAKQGSPGSVRKPRYDDMYDFTDDTAMARSVAKSLIQHNKLDTMDMAKRFTEEYMKEPARGYGGSVCTVFQTLHDTKYSDICAPARNQFDGSGSYGNGGAMRIGPAGVFAEKKGLDFEGLSSLTRDITCLTHTHPDAINGAILQSYAVQLALATDKLDTDVFIDKLLEKMKVLEQTDQEKKQSQEKMEVQESADEKSVDEKKSTYCDKLEKIRVFVNQEKQPTIGQITKELGVYISALESVPAAIYCFLRATKPIDGIEEYNEFQRTIMYSISHGGDTDTVATMAGAIAGAYYGLDLIPLSWRWCCEGVEEAEKDAELLFNLPE